MTGTGQRGAFQRMDNIAVVVDDLDAAKAFFTELGMELEGEATLEGGVVDRLLGLDAVLTDIAMMRTPDGSGRIELTKYHRPASPDDDRRAPVHALGSHRVMFAVTDIQDVVDRLEPHGAELLGDIVTYEDSHRLAYLRGPAGIILALAEQLT